MAKKRIVLVAIACFSATLLAAQGPSFLLRKHPPRKPGMTDEEHRSEIEKLVEERRQSKQRMDQERIEAMQPPAWKQLLRISERQWKMLEPKIDRIQVIGRAAWGGGAGSRGRDAQSFHWYKYSEGTPRTRAKAPHEMSDGERLADELVDLLRDENSKDEEIRKKIDALQRVRENARKELAEVKRELAAIPMTPRQEAIFLVMGCID